VTSGQARTGERPRPDVDAKGATIIDAGVAEAAALKPQLGAEQAFAGAVTMRTRAR
jgi:hypothetical protein